MDKMKKTRHMIKPRCDFATDSLDSVQVRLVVLL